MGKSRQPFQLKIDLSYGIQNITPRLDDNDDDWTQFQFFSPGIVLSKPFKIAENKVHLSPNPQLISHNWIISLGVHYLKINENTLDGLLFDVGLGYQLSQLRILDYKLKQ